MENLYVIRCRNWKELFYKIWTTSNKVSRRFDSSVWWSRKMPYWYDIVFLTMWEYQYIWKCESLILEKFKDFSYIPEIKFCWYCECLKLDDPEIVFQEIYKNLKR